MTEKKPITVGELIEELSSYHKDIPIRVIYLDPPSFPLEKCYGFIKKIEVDTSNFDFCVEVIVENPAHPDYGKLERKQNYD